VGVGNQARSLFWAAFLYDVGMSEDSPENPAKRDAMRRFAGDAAKYATRFMPGTRLVHNLDPDLFRRLYDAGMTRNTALPKDFKDRHGRQFFRPPGALHEDEFLDVCSRCAKCVDVCPERCLHPAREEEGPPVGTPVFRPNHIACTMCGDCMEACPTGALKPTPVGEMRMGIAVVEPDTCLGYQEQECRACYDACPLEPNAIAFDKTKPKVDSRVCTGCGLCVHECPTNPPSIIVLPRPKRG
jgi:ferredoxin-type protein NapG